MQTFLASQTIAEQERKRNYR